jgi:hypothetical protein
MSRPRARCHPAHARLDSHGGILCHLDETVYALPQHASSQRNGQCRHRSVSDTPDRRSTGGGVNPTSSAPRLTVSLWRRAQHASRPPYRCYPCPMPTRAPTVLTKEETFQIIEPLSGTPQFMARRLYGGGLRLMECLRLRVNTWTLPNVRSSYGMATDAA